MLEQKIISIFLIISPVLVLLKLWYLLKRQVEQDACEHKDTSIVVIEVTVTCEKTAIQCDYCGKILTEPENDCR